MLFSSIPDALFKGDQLGIDCFEVNLFLGYRCADIAGDIEVEIVLLDLCHLHSTGVAGLLDSVLIGGNDLIDVCLAQLVLALALDEVFSSVDEEHIVGLLASLQNKDADRNTSGIEEIGGQAYNGIDVTIHEQLSADALLSTTTEKHSMGQDDGHHAFLSEEIKAVQQEGKVGGRFWG